jgi:hypothetical protein
MNELITIRISAELRQKLLEWRREQPDLPSEPEAIRRIIEAATAKGKKR